MIHIDFTQAVAGYLFLSIAFVFTFWLTGNKIRDEKYLNNLKYLQQCIYCTYIFFNYKESEWQTCPRCKSYMRRGESKSKLNPSSQSDLRAPNFEN